MEIFSCEQNSDEWRKLRAGIPTASEFSTVLASGKGGGESKTRKTYLYKLAGEVITGEPAESFTNKHLERGHAMEPDARNLYHLMHDGELTQVGFIRAGNAGCSPDSLVNNDGMLEIKTALPHILIENIMRGEFPPEHKAQCQGQLWIAQREWINIVIYWPKMPLFVKRMNRDDAYIKNLSTEVDRFNDELATLVAKIRTYE